VRIYADASWWVPFKCRRDVRHAAALELLDRHPDDELLWTPWHRVEVFNTLRQVTRDPDSPLKVTEARQIIRLLEQEVRLGYYAHFEFDWRDAIRTACELSAEAGFTQRLRSMDLFHVAVAQEACADLFVSFDDDQLDVAGAAALDVLNPGA
jgi:predicted nucleic acid-binding protein